MNEQHEQQNFQNSTQIPPQQNHGGHALFEAHAAIRSLVNTIEQYTLFHDHIQDQQLVAISQRQKTFLSQMYNSMIDTMKSGQDPIIPTQTYHMEENNDVTYGIQPSPPKTPIQSMTELNDECISNYLAEQLKTAASQFTMTALESTNPILRRMFADSIPNIIEMAYEIFLYQNKQKYYQVPQLQLTDMTTIQNEYAPIQNDLLH